MKEHQLHRAFLEVIAKCNQPPCLYCRNYEGDKGRAIDSTAPSYEEIIDRIKQVKEIGGREVVLTGGEPFLRDDLTEIANYCSDSKLLTIVATNGRQLTADRLKAINKDVVIQVSLDSIDEKVNNSLRGEGSYKAAFDAISLCQNYDVPLQISTTITSVNLANIPDLVKYFSSEKIKLRRLVEEGLAKRNYQLQVKEKDLTNILQNIITSSEFKERVAAEQIPYIFDCDGQPELYRCSAGNSILYIKANGDVAPCPSVSGVVGNVRKENLKQIWKVSFSQYRADQYRSFGFCGRNAMINLTGHESAQADEPMQYDQFSSNGCKCTG